MLHPRLNNLPKLALGTLGINHGKCDGLKRKIPTCKPRILPLVGHGENAFGVHILPERVATLQSLSGRRRKCWIALEPRVNVELVPLKVPQQSSECLALNVSVLRFVRMTIERLIKCVGFF